MRLTAFTIAFALGMACLQAMAEDLASAPGWSLNKIVEQQNEENTYTDARVYFSLKPPDARPAVSVDSRTADRLRSGDANAEATYGGQANRNDKKDEDEFVYGKHGNGIVMADAVNSTLTSEEGRKDLPPAPSAPAARPSSASSSSAFSGLGSGSGLSSDAAHGTAARALGMQHNTSGASSNPNSVNPAASASPAADSGSGPAPDPRAIASAANVPPASAGPAHFAPVAVNNTAQGFGVSVPKSSSTDTNFVVWPNGDPSTQTGTDSNVSKCSATVARTFNTATLERFTVPKGCTNVRIRAWGAGGGSGSGYTTSGEDSASVTGEGGGGAYVYTEGVIDTSQYDLVVVVGSPGGDGNSTAPGARGFLSGGKGGTTGGGGGGGYSGLFLVDKIKYHDGETPQAAEWALAVAAGGGGGSATGEAGGAGGIDVGGGTFGATQNVGGVTSGNGRRGAALQGGDAGDSTGGFGGGGGGGGGYFGGGGGGGTSTEGGTAGAGGGGASYWRFPTSASKGIKADGAKAGNYDYKPRGSAGNAGKSGLVVVEFY